jgi:hypothetical protein
MKIGSEPIIAVSLVERNQFGCPHCGYRSGVMRMTYGGSGVWYCGDTENCGRVCCVLWDEVTCSSIEIGGVYPTLQAHPRRGIPSHGRSDKRPDGGGEFFRSRGIGRDETPGCFVCGGDTCIRHNIAAFVRCQTAGQRVLRLFPPRRARLDYRDFEPDRVQVKIGACDAHLPNLETLHAATADGIITRERINAARS